ncbi:hypothetical protein ABU186_10910 (plasmid) [Weissella paramesenteroides]
MLYILSFLVFLRKVFDWFMALSPSQQFAIARGVIRFVDWLNKSYHSWITWCKHWYDTRHHKVKNDNEEHVDNKKEQWDSHIPLFLLLLYVTVLIILIVK